MIRQHWRIILEQCLFFKSLRLKNLYILSFNFTNLKIIILNLSKFISIIYKFYNCFLIIIKINYWLIFSKYVIDYRKISDSLKTSRFIKKYRINPRLIDPSYLNGINFPFCSKKNTHTETHNIWFLGFV